MRSNGAERAGFEDPRLDAHKDDAFRLRSVDPYGRRDIRQRRQLFGVGAVQLGKILTNVIVLPPLDQLADQ